MRQAFAWLVVAGCGRIGFDATGPASDGGNDPPLVDAGPPPMLACSETRSAGGGISGSEFRAVVTVRGLAAVWLDGAGALLGATWTLDASGAPVSRGVVAMEQGPFTRLFAASRDDQIFIATSNGSQFEARTVRGDLARTGAIAPFAVDLFTGRNPLAPRRGGPGFVAITQTTNSETVVYDIDRLPLPAAHPIAALQGHTSPSIAVDSDGYAIVTHGVDPVNSACFYTKLDDAFAAASVPSGLDRTQQADCFGAIVAASGGPDGAGIAWSESDPANVSIEFKGTTTRGGTASASGQTGEGAPMITATSTGFAVAYLQSPEALRAFDAAGNRAIAPAARFADLVTWADRAILVWTTPAGDAQLTRLCP